MVSNARLDLPDPDRPVKTIMASRGRSSETSLRLCSRAPRPTTRSATCAQFSRVDGQPSRVWGRLAMLSGVLTKRGASAGCGCPACNVRRVPVVPLRGRRLGCLNGYDGDASRPRQRGPARGEIGDRDGAGMTYTGDVSVGGPADTREVPGLALTKAAVVPVDNNAYLLR